MRRPSWDPAQYQEAHSFVWENACALLEVMNPKPGERILDLGSGTGQLTAGIAAFGAEVVGIDSSETMIDAARANYPTVRFVCGDARNYSSEQRFDAIFSNAALHGASPAEQSALAISRHLNPGGRLFADLADRTTSLLFLGQYEVSSQNCEIHGIFQPSGTMFRSWNRLVLM